jgi:hypothetical protein
MHPEPFFVGWDPEPSTKFLPVEPKDVKRFVAKLVKSFGRLGDASESLDDFRYSIVF